MTDEIQKLLEKYNPAEIFSTIEENCDDSKIRAGSFVLISAAALKNEDIRRPLIAKKGDPYVAQLEKLASDNQVMYVSALKTLRTTSGYLSEAPSSHPEEADLALHTVPGLYQGIITVPVSILTPYKSPGELTQVPIDSRYNAKTETKKGTELENEYIKGKQPKNTVSNP